MFGKTELSKAISEELFGNENSMIRLDMSEYMESHSVSKLIGAPPGYVGFESGGELTEKVRRRPYSVILFDEIEKAHIDVMNILLQILEDGRLTDSSGKTVSFKNTIIIMTSNIGAKLISQRRLLGFGNYDEDSDKEYQNIKKEVLEQLKKEFRPEFLNRIDEIIVFNKLQKETLKQIIDKMLNILVKNLEDKNIRISVKDSVKDLILEKSGDNNFGARPLKRKIQTIIEDKIAEELLKGNIKNGDNIEVTRFEDNVKINVIN